MTIIVSLILVLKCVVYGLVLYGVSCGDYEIKWLFTVYSLSEAVVIFC